MLETVLFMALAAAPVPDPVDSMRRGVELSLKGDHEASEAVLKHIRITDPTLDFYRLVNAFRLNKRKDVERYARDILEGFGVEYPQRYKDLAYIMRADASTWKNDADDLGDISREMDKITDRLKNNKGGSETQGMQRDVLDRLAKMIKDEEDKKKAAQEAAEKAQADADAEANKRRDSAGGQGNPAQDTIKGQEQGTGQVDAKRVKEIAETWGKLPEKERAKAIRELTRSIPVKDRAVIERYLQELQKKSTKR